MLPIDPDYKSSAPLHVQQLACFQQLLQSNFDPYAPHSRNEEICRMLEAAANANGIQQPVKAKAKTKAFLN
jgi:hypothetical protein